MRRLASAVLTGVLALTLVGCGTKEEVKVLDGTIGDTLSTLFFDYTVNSFRLEDSLDGVTPHDGYKFLVVDVTITNTSGSAITMTDRDFFITWDNNDKNHDYPYTVYDSKQLVPNQLGEEYEVKDEKDDDSVTGSLVFAVPPDRTDFALKTQDYYIKNDTGETVEGDVYTISFKIGGEEAPAEEPPAEEAPAEDDSSDSE